MKFGAWVDRLVLYLPVILMALLAGASYWLVQRAPALANKPAPRAPTHEPDYLMREFSVRTFDAQGRLTSEVAGALARHFPDTDTFEIEQVRIRRYDVDGSLTRARAAMAKTNADASQVELVGQAEVIKTQAAGSTRKDEMRLTGERLLAFLEERRVTSSEPVQIERGADRFTANAMRLDDRAQELILQGRVRGLVQPGSTQTNRKP